MKNFSNGFFLVEEIREGGISGRYKQKESGHKKEESLH
jgi:hypothetical protein